MLTSGTVLIEKDTPRPQCFQVEDDSYPNAWLSVKHSLTPRELEGELSTAGWTFFYMANAIRATAKTIPAALKRLMTNVRRQGCNCFEIDEVTTRSFLGMPYVSVFAHPRHIQKGMAFSGR